MSRKTWAMSAFIGCLMGLIAPLAQAASDETSNLAQDFATCLGRYAAQQNYDRLMGRDVSEAAARAQMFGELLHAIAPAEDDGLRALRKSRKGAEGAHWTLLHSADFSFDPRLAHHAQSTAARNLAMCEMLVLG
ncbi:MAG: hypothetical protein AAF227_02285 [Pseudomonadota bacterium]